MHGSRRFSSPYYAQFRGEQHNTSRNSSPSYGSAATTVMNNANSYSTTPHSWRRLSNDSFSHSSEMRGRPYHRFKKWRGGRPSLDSDDNRNPGSSNDIRQYINPAMLKDPWEDLK